MALAKKVSLSVVLAILLLFSAASFFVHARSKSYGKIQITWEDIEHQNYFSTYVSLRGIQDHRKYQTYLVYLWNHPNGKAMDDKDARRSWYESFLPSTLTDSGEPRLLHCYAFDVNGFLARLTRAEAIGLAKKPGIRNMFSDEYGPYSYSTASCGFETTATTKTRFARSRLAFQVYVIYLLGVLAILISVRA